MRPSSAIDTVPRAKKATTTLGRLKRSPNQPPAIAPTTPPKFSISRNDRLDPRL
ncbi:hypothetical protein D3C71_2145610 [compost metagenome]